VEKGRIFIVVTTLPNLLSPCTILDLFTAAKITTLSRSRKSMLWKRRSA